jgi:predicted DNA binding protein
MPEGIRATVEFPSVDTCPIVALSEAEETTIDSVNSNICPADSGESVVEFLLDATDEIDADLRPIFSHGSTERYRLTLDEASNCPCQHLGRFGCPVARYVVRDGTLTLVFYAADYDQLQEVIADLRDRDSTMNIKRFIRSSTGERAEDSVFIDRGKLTARQLEVLETAYELGYFERPRRSNATEIAAELDITPSTFREHITAAEQKIFADLL